MRVSVRACEWESESGTVREWSVGESESVRVDEGESESL